MLRQAITQSPGPRILIQSRLSKTCAYQNLKNCWPPVESSVAVPERCPWPAAWQGARTKPRSSLRNGQLPRQGLLAQAQLDTAVVLVCKTLQQRSAKNMGSSLLCVMVSHQLLSEVSFTKHLASEMKNFVKISLISFWKSEDLKALESSSTWEFKCKVSCSSHGVNSRYKVNFFNFLGWSEGLCAWIHTWRHLFAKE